MNVSLSPGDKIICDSVAYNYLGCCRYGNYVFKNPRDGEFLTLTWPEILHWWNEGVLEVRPLTDAYRAEMREFLKRVGLSDWGDSSHSGNSTHEDAFHD